MRQASQCTAQFVHSPIRQGRLATFLTALPFPAAPCAWPCCLAAAGRRQQRPAAAAPRAPHHPSCRRVHPPGGASGWLAGCTLGGVVEQAQGGGGWGQQVQLVSPAVRAGRGLEQTGMELAHAAWHYSNWMIACTAGRDQVPSLATACSHRLATACWPFESVPWKSTSNTRTVMGPCRGQHRTQAGTAKHGPSGRRPIGMEDSTAQHSAAQHGTA